MRGGPGKHSKGGRDLVTAAILGSSFAQAALGGIALIPIQVPTRFGQVTLHQVSQKGGRKSYVLFRHGAPHRWLPNQIPYRAHAEALAAVGCRALLVTSSVGVVSEAVPLFTPLVVDDLFMLENRLPDGSACSIFDKERPEQGHLVIEEGLFSKALSSWLDLAAGLPLKRVVFAYVGGPRTKTAAENRWLAAAGVEVNSMSVGPEVVLANELEIPTAALVVGHKYSLPPEKRPPSPLGAAEPQLGHQVNRLEQGLHGGQKLDQEALSRSLVEARLQLEKLVVAFLEEVEPPAFRNRLYRF